MSGTRSICYLLCIIAIAQGDSKKQKKTQDDAYSDQSSEVRNNSNFIANYNSGSDSFSCDQQLEMCQDKDLRQDFLYSLYKKLEASLIGNPMVLHKLRQVFFPITGTHIQEVGRAFFNVSISAFCSLDQQKCCFSKFTKTFLFIWTTSPLISMVTIDQFLIMDSVITPNLYERIATSMTDYRLLIPFDVYDLQCPPQEEEIVKALVHLLSWVKAYARSDGKPDTFEERDKGYIVKYYNYYTTESFYKKEHHDHARNIRLALLVIVVCLNILLPVGFAFGGAKRLQNMLIPDGHHTANNIKKSVAITIVVTNVLYITFSVVSAITPAPHHSSLECITTSKRHCNVPTNSTLYWDEAATMTSVYLFFPLAVGFELIIAILLQIQTRDKRIKTKLATNCCCNAFLLWNAMIVVQIWVGLILLPVMILLIIAPSQTISLLGCIGLIEIHISLTIKYLFFDDKCSQNCKCYLFFLVKLLVCLVLTLFLLALGIIYFEILEVGLSLQTLKGFVLSLFPSFILTMLAWVIQTKVMKNKRLNQSNGTKWNQFALKCIPGEEHQSLLDAIQSDEESDVV